MAEASAVRHTTSMGRPEALDRRRTTESVLEPEAGSSAESVSTETEGAASSSWIVMVVAPREIEAFEGTESARTTVSSSSSSASWRMERGNFREVCPGSKLTLPDGEVKSDPAVAVEPVPRPNWTETVLPEGAERTTSTESVPTPSVVEAVAAAKPTDGAGSSSWIV
jgi:hypothetical protein